MRRSNAPASASVFVSRRFSRMPLQNLCAEKRMLELRQRVADICEECVQTIERACVSDQLVRQVASILEACRG